MVHEQTGLPEDHMLMAASHTHSATSSRGRPACSCPTTTSTTTSGSWPIASPTACAGRSTTSSRRRIGWGTVDVPEHVNNRRWLMKPGTHLMNPFGGMDKVQMNPRSGSPELIEPAGPTDPQVSFLSVQSAEGRPIALLANYSLHYVGGVPRRADLGRLLRHVRRPHPAAARGRPARPAVRGHHVQRHQRRRQQHQLPHAPPRAPQALRADAATWPTTWPRRSFEATEAGEVPRLGAAGHEAAGAGAGGAQAHARAVWPGPASLAAGAKPTPGRPHEEIYARRILQQQEAPASITVILQALRIGDVGIAAIPFEVFAEIGLELKEKSPLQPTFTIELANGTYGYLPTPRQHALGGYETWLGSNKVEIEASTKIERVIVELLRRLQGDRAVRDR